jgi:hypothetical protein
MRSRLSLGIIYSSYSWFRKTRKPMNKLPKYEFVRISYYTYP